MKPRSFQERVREAMAGRQQAPYHEILTKVYPHALFPRAWRYSSNGGPPGCAMSFMRGIHRMGGRRFGPLGHDEVFVPKESPKGNDCAAE